MIDLQCSLGIIGLLVSSLVVPRWADADEVVTIGFAAPLTGAQAQFGKETENGARLAIAEINASAPAINGQRVTFQLDSQDDAGDPRLATEVAQRFVDENVVAVVGHLSSGTSVPASHIYSSAGIAEISPAATSPLYTHQGFKSTFRLVATDTDQGAALARFAAGSLRLHSVLLVDDQTEFGKSLSSSFERAALSNGMTISGHEAISPYGLDFRALLTTLKARPPDAILFSGSIGPGVPFIRQARQLGIRSTILSGDGICAEALGTIAGEAADGVICSMPGADFRRIPQGVVFSVNYRKRYGVQAGGAAPYAYDAVWVIENAMIRANSTRAADILKMMPATDMQGATGRITFDRSGDLKEPHVTMYRYRDGERQALANEQTTR